MTKGALEIKPELVIGVVREAIEYLPVVQQPKSANSGAANRKVR